MIKRIIASFGLLLCLCFTATANQELTIKLDNKNTTRQTEELGFAYLTFEYLCPNGNNAIVRVIVENITSNPPHAILLFRNERTEKFLKENKPKIEFVKTYVGKKGTRSVKGCREFPKDIYIIPAAVTDTMIINVPFTSSKNFKLPLYEARYKARDLSKKGVDNIKYTILAEHLYDVNIEVVGWTVEDPTYVATKNAVDNFISSLKGVTFCSNKKHQPSLKQQQRPYQEKKDKLIKDINDILETNSVWMSTDAPHKAYTQLLTELNKVNLDDMAADCGDHKRPIIIGGGHKCSLCQLSTQVIYQRLDDLYQRLYAGQISKNQALRTARSLYTCYQKNKKRKKDASYGSKISKFYNGIANY